MENQNKAEEVDKKVEKTREEILKRPDLFSSKEAYKRIRAYFPGKNATLDLALMNLYTAIEKKMHINRAIKILESVALGEIKSNAVLLRKIESEYELEIAEKMQYAKEVESLKNIVLEEGVITPRNLMLRCRTRQKGRIMQQAKDAGMRIVDMNKLTATLKRKNKRKLLSDLEYLLGSINARTVVMSPEFCQKMVKEIKE